LMHVVCYFALGVFLVVGSCDLPGSDYFIKYVIWGNFLPHGIVILVTSLIGGTVNTPISSVTEGTTTAPPWPTNLVEYQHFFFVPIGDIYILFNAALVLYILKYNYDKECSSFKEVDTTASDATSSANPASSLDAVSEDSVTDGPSRHLAIAMRIIGSATALLLVTGYSIPLDGWRWKCGDCEKWIHADHQWKYEPMIVVWGAGLGVFLVLGSWDLPGSKQLLNFAIWGECFAHGIQMLIRAVVEWETEKAHVYPWGSVTVRLLFGVILLILNDLRIFILLNLLTFILLILNANTAFAINISALYRHIF